MTSSHSLPLVLASGSPSRLSILRMAGIEPVVAVATDVDEEAMMSSLSDGTAPGTVVETLAAAKGRAVATTHPDQVVVGADSMLLLAGALQGKPHTVSATIARWREQRGSRAQLLTGVAIISPQGEFLGHSITDVHFADATDAEIEAYARTGEPLACAGAFTLEAIGGWFIDRIEGDPSGVIGLPLPLLRRGLRSLGYEVTQFWNTASAQPQH